MYCWKCFQKIDGAAETYYNVAEDRIEWYHTNCYTRPKLLTEEEKIAAKTMARFIKTIGKVFIGNESDK